MPTDRCQHIGRAQLQCGFACAPCAGGSPRGIGVPKTVGHGGAVGHTPCETATARGAANGESSGGIGVSDGGAC